MTTAETSSQRVPRIGVGNTTFPNAHVTQPDSQVSRELPVLALHILKWKF